MANPSSSKTFTSLVPTGESPRGYYLQHPDEAEPTHIAHSSFIPTAMVEHLMRNKKDSAIAEKFKTDPHVYEDQITMIEGALHTFVTPIVPITTHGDYVWDIYHNTFTFGNRAGHQLARKAVMSGLVQQDFEKDNVMMQVCACGENEIIGTNVFPKMIDLHGKHKTETRQKYETQLRHYLVYHLTAAHKLPAAGKVKDMTKEEAMEWLAEIVQSPKPAADIPKLFRRRFFHHTYEHYYEGTTKNYVLSLEIIFNSALCQVKNDFLPWNNSMPPKATYIHSNPLQSSFVPSASTPAAQNL
ncbi:hypothetical protein EJ08DRAFT_646391 [Tothia fuscella]|uniref:Uncharacterized protein n=1 Tax=Tothia fuscella TaxID=1048955 RepID=A0A9P4NZA7_9PEZI|nr:hypothetical protein EJ08DRAFT_646391 [Tothia fuscella]